MLFTDKRDIVIKGTVTKGIIIKIEFVVDK